MKAETLQQVAEVQGLYGPFTFPEVLLQQIWRRGEFQQTAIRTTEGKALDVLHPGRWNRLGGPDFRSARLRLDGVELVGDVELHLHAEDWAAHGHEGDPAYDAVVLHVVLFPPKSATVTRRHDGRAIPVLVLLPLLWRGLEEYAEEAAVERLAGWSPDHATAVLARLPADELRDLLEKHAELRWQSKVHYAGQRLARLGWEGACQHAVLEVLGYRFNRAPMLSVAGRWSLADWVAGRVTAETAWAAEADRWSVQGVRPANHPRTRLRQYEAWARALADWPDRWREVGRGLPPMPSARDATPEVRRVCGLSALRRRLVQSLCAGAIGGTRFDNLVCDAWLPLLAAGGVGDARGLWWHWFPGDEPDVLRSVLQAVGVFKPRLQPEAHGPLQGLLGWWLAREQAESAGGGRRA